MLIQRVLTLVPTHNSGGEPYLQAQLLTADQGELIDAVGDIRLPQDGEQLLVDMSAGQFLNEFHAGRADLLQEAAKSYGRKLYLSMFAANSELGREWARACNLAQKDGLRLEIRLNQRDANGEPVHWDGWPLAMIPFELLHDGKGFLFRRMHWRSVRTLRNQPTRAPRTRTLADTTGNTRARVLLGCANVRQLDGTPRLAQADFQAHADAVAELGSNGQAHCLPPLMWATSTQLAASLQTHQPEVLIWVGHGVEKGNALILHDEKSPYYPEDSGTPMQAGDFANLARGGAVDLAFLWSCHGAGTRQALDLGVAEALLDPDQGDVMAVVASYSALPSAAIADFAGQVLQAWALDAEGDLEQGLARARAGLPEQSLLWARPVLLSRAKRTQAVYQLPRPIVEPEPLGAPVSGNLRWLPPLLNPSPHFLGRDDFFKLAEHNLQTHAVLVLEGLPGVGKTEMALALAHEWRSEGRDVAFMEVTAFASAGDLVPRMGQWRGLDKVESDEQLFAAYRGVPLLLVVDNAEDILGKATDTPGRLLALLTGLHEASPAGFRCLITSRRSLVSEGEALPSWISTLEVPQLPPEDARALFINSAGPRLAQHQHALVDGLMVELDGIARAIVLMASQLSHEVDVPELQRRIREMGVAAISAEEVFGEEISPKFDRRFAKERLLSSLNLALAAAEKECPEALWLFDLMGSFPGGLAQDWLPFEEHPWLQPALAVLLQHHLVSLRGDERRLSQAAPISSLARLRLEKQGDMAVLWPLLAHLHQHLAKHVAEMHKLFLTPKADIALRWFSREEYNLRIAIQHLCGQAQAVSIEITIDIVFCLLRFYWYMGHAKAGLQHFAKFAEAMPRPWQMIVENGYIQYVVGDLKVLDNDHAGAFEHYLVASQFFSPHEEQLDHANALLGMGNVKRFCGDLVAANKYYERALGLYNLVPDLFGQGNTLKAMGDLQLRKGDLQNALHFFMLAKPIFENANNPVGHANTLLSLATIGLHMGDFADAEPYLKNALAIFKSVHDTLGQATVHRTWGDVKRRQIELSDARTHYQTAKELFEARGDTLGQANTCKALGLLYFAEGKLALAFTTLMVAMHQLKIKDIQHEVAACHIYLARVAEQAGEYSQAITLTAQALLISKESNNPPGQVMAWEDIGLQLLYTKPEMGIAALYCAANLATIENMHDNERINQLFYHELAKYHDVTEYDQIVADLKGEAQPKLELFLNNLGAQITAGEINPYAPIQEAQDAN